MQLKSWIETCNLSRFADRLVMLDAASAKPIVSRERRLEPGMTRGSLQQCNFILQIRR